jgi:NNP family nitrate/nitrite transporter-like MFS transporter
MSNISFFFPRAEKGTALGLNAGLGNLGVSGVQLAVPLVVAAALLGPFAGGPQLLPGGKQIWLQNAAFVWVPLVVLASVLAWFGMDDLATAKASFREQSVIFRRKHNWLVSLLYLGTFGSFIGYSAGFPLLAKTQFPAIDALPFVFLGPLVGALSRSATGWVADKWGGGRVTLWVFVAMMLGVVGILYFIGIKDKPGAFWGFFAMFLLLFFATGVGNASTFQMIPNIMRQEMARLMPTADAATRLRQAEKESAAITGFTSAIATFGAFFIPKSYGTSIELTGGVQAALWGFFCFYVICVVVTWAVYTRKGGVLHDIERGGRIPTAAQPAE